MGGVVVALGNFDGVHLGHRAVIDRAVAEGRRLGERVLAATFDPHPRAVIRPQDAPALLSTVHERKRLLVEAGVDEVAIIPFDRELSEESPGEFVESVLVGRLGAGVVVVGENFRFGHRASGGVEDLAGIMSTFGGEAIAVAVEGGEEAISSTRIRDLLSGGDVAGAARLLGRNYALSGRVVSGEGRGGTIGFPTANVEPPVEVVVPARGVYACRARFEGEEHGACVNIGVAPTFVGERASRVEAHILDFEGDLYGRAVEVEFVERIREEKKFAGVEELVAQIQSDELEARRMLENVRGEHS